MIERIPYADREQWMSIRGQYIGGSDAGAVMGMNPYKSAYALWAEKTGKMPPTEENVTTRVGAYLEDFVAKMFEEATGKKVRNQNFTLVNDRFPWACANLDRVVVGENAFLEIKTTNSLPNMRKIRGGDFPDAWYCQCMHYLAVSELDKAYLAVLVGCREFYTFELERNEDEIDALMRAEKRFWDHVVSDTMPEADGTASTTDAIETIYPDSDGEQVDLTAFENDLREYTAVSLQIRGLEAIRDEYANKVKGYMQNASEGHCSAYKCTWRNQERKSFDSKAFADEHPKMDLSKYYKTTKSRVFRVTEVKERT